MSLNLIDPPKARAGCGPLLRSAQSSQRPLRQQAFDFVRSHENAARADMAHALGVSAASTTTVTADLMASGYLREVEGQTGAGGRGRPKVLLQVVPEAGFVIGFKLSLHRHTAVLTDFAGMIRAQVAANTPPRLRSVAELTQEIEQLSQRLLSRAKMTWAQIGGLSLGMPGIVDHLAGTVQWSPMLRERDVDLQMALAARFGCPVAVDNDANMLTLSELWFGKGRALSDFAVVTIESGVGMGLVLNNALFRGSHGMGLELGHTKVVADGALCQCGQRGCLEAYLGEAALAREAATALGQGAGPGEPPADALAQLLARAQDGDARAEEVFQRAGRFLAVGLSNVVQLFDPALIILSGARLGYAELYAEQILEQTRGMTLHEGRRPIGIAIDPWDDFAWARGASALALSRMTETLIGGEVRAA